VGKQNGIEKRRRLCQTSGSTSLVRQHPRWSELGGCLRPGSSNSPATRTDSVYRDSDSHSACPAGPATWLEHKIPGLGVGNQTEDCPVRNDPFFLSNFRIHPRVQRERCGGDERWRSARESSTRSDTSRPWFLRLIPSCSTSGVRSPQRPRHPVLFHPSSSSLLLFFLSFLSHTPTRILAAGAPPFGRFFSPRFPSSFLSPGPGGSFPPPLDGGVWTGTGRWTGRGTSGWCLVGGGSRGGGSIPFHLAWVPFPPFPVRIPLVLRHLSNPNTFSPPLATLVPRSSQVDQEHKPVEPTPHALVEATDQHDPRVETQDTSTSET